MSTGGKTYEDLADGAHLHDVLELLVHVAQRELAVLEALDELLVVLELQLLHLVHEALDVAEAEQLLHERLHAERLEVVQVLARADKDDRTVGGRDGRERAAAARVAVQLGHDHGAHVHLLLKRARLRLARLPDRRVHHVHDLVGSHRALQREHLLEQRRLLLVAPGHVHDDQLEALLFEARHAYNQQETTTEIINVCKSIMHLTNIYRHSRW